MSTSLTRMFSLSALGLLALTGCQPEEDENLYTWDVKVTGVEDNCNEEDVASTEKLTFGVAFDGSLATLKVVDETTDAFATGSISGCTISYESAVVGEPDRAGGPVQWVLSGEAVYRTGGDTCNMAENVQETMDRLAISTDDYDYLDGNAAEDLDWVGIETFEVVASENEQVPVGCTYTSFVAGTYTQ